jgi:F-type H+-transporting ATPase subunit b
MGQDPKTWVAVALILFILVLVYFRVPALILKALDDRSAAIAKELAEAKALREEAEAILAEYRRRAAGVEAEAAAILQQAEREAEAYGKEARNAFDEMLTRRMNLAELKIRQEEENARKQIRAQAASIAVAAAEQLIEQKVTGKVAEDMISSGIERIKKRLH